MTSIHQLHPKPKQAPVVYMMDVNNPPMKRLIAACDVIHYDGAMPDDVRLQLVNAMRAMNKEFVEFIEDIGAISVEADNAEMINKIATSLIPIILEQVRATGRFHETTTLALLRYIVAFG